MPDHDPLCPATIADGRWRARCECDLIARVVERERSTMDAREASVRADERKRWGLGWVAAADNVQALAHAEAVAAKLVDVIRVDDLRLRTQKGHTAQARRERDAARAEARIMADQNTRLLADIGAARAEVERLRSPEWEAEVRADEKAKADLAILFWEQENKTLQERWARASEAAAGEHDRLRAEVAALKKDMQDGNEATAQVMEELRQKSAEVAALREEILREVALDTAAGIVDPGLRAALRDEVLADLREQVLMLEHDATCSFIPQDGPCDCVRGAVLALIEEAQS